MVRVLILVGGILYSGLSSRHYIQFILFSICLMQNVETLWGSKSFAEKSPKCYVTEPGFLACSFPNLKYIIFLKMEENSFRNVLFPLSSRMDDDQIIEALSQQMLMYRFEPHQSGKGLKIQFFNSMSEYSNH